MSSIINIIIINSSVLWTYESMNRKRSSQEQKQRTKIRPNAITPNTSDTTEKARKRERDRRPKPSGLKSPNQEGKRKQNRKFIGSKSRRKNKKSNEGKPSSPVLIRNLETDKSKMQSCLCIVYTRTLATKFLRPSDASSTID